MKKASGAYKAGYEIARARLEGVNPDKSEKATLKAVQDLLKEFNDDERIYDGIISAAVDYQNENEWEF